MQLHIYISTRRYLIQVLLKKSIKRNRLCPKTGSAARRLLRPTLSRIERIDSIITEPKRKIKLGIGSMRSKRTRLLKHYEPYNFYLPLGSLNRREKRDSSRRSGAVRAGCAIEKERETTMPGRQRSNINVECLWFYRFILFLSRQSIKYCFN